MDNVNQFIHQYWIEHAQRLLHDEAQAKRSILAIGIDRGFASIGPFNRAFKAITGSTPRQYRAAARSRPAIRSTPTADSDKAFLDQSGDHRIALSADGDGGRKQ